jgi:hypothetical protein
MHQRRRQFAGSPPPTLACTRRTGAGVCCVQAHHRLPAWVAPRQLPVQARSANRLKQGSSWRRARDGCSLVGVDDDISIALPVDTSSLVRMALPLHGGVRT